MKAAYPYLIELRKRLMHSVIVVGILFLIFSFFAKNLYHILATPILLHLPTDKPLIATGIAAPFLVPFKFALVLAIFIAMPFLLYQLWGFIAPALYKHEKRWVWPLLFISSGLFYLGAAFAYFIVFPLVFKFFIAAAPAGVEVRPDISLYLDFTLKLFFAFGLAFEVPIATLLLIITGATTREKLAKKRPYVIVGAFVVGMLLTPPDVVSQILLAVPIWVLFELGLLMARFRMRHTKPKYT